MVSLDLQKVVSVYKILSRVKGVWLGSFTIFVSLARFKREKKPCYSPESSKRSRTYKE